MAVPYLEDAAPFPLTGLVSARVISGGAATKVVWCTFHSTLPWIAICPKNGTSVLVWNYAEDVPVCDTGVATSTFLNGSDWGAATKPEQCFFLDTTHLAWLHYQQRAHLYDPAAPGVVAAAGPTPIERRERFSPSVAALRSRLQMRSGVATMSNGDDPEAPLLGLSDGTLPLAVITSNTALVLASSTGVVTHALPPRMLQSRLISCSRLIATRADEVLLTERSFARLIPELVLGCSDGSIGIWTVAATAEAPSEPYRVGVLRFILTPHSSPITSIVFPAFVNTTNYKSVPSPSDLIRVDGPAAVGDGTPPVADLSFANRRPKTFVSAIVATKGGSLIHVVLYGCPPGLIAAQETAATSARLNNDSQAVVYSIRRVHQTILDVQLMPLSSSVRHSASLKTYVNDSTTENELVSASLSRQHIYCLGPTAVTFHHGRSGAELRRVSFAGTIASSCSPRALVVNTYFVGIACCGDDHFAIHHDGNPDTLRPWIRLSDGLHVSTAGERAARTQSAPYSESRSFPPFASAAVASSSSSKEPPVSSHFTASRVKITCYGAVLDAVQPNCRVAFLTNEGCVVIEPTRSSTVISERGVAQSQIVFPSAIRCAADSSSARSSSRGAPRRSNTSDAASSNSIATGGKTLAASASSKGDRTTVSFLLCIDRGRVVVADVSESLSSARLYRSLSFSTSYVLQSLHELAVGQKDTNADVLPSVGAKTKVSDVVQRMVLEPSPVFKVLSVFVSALCELVCIITDDFDLLVFEVAQQPLSSPLMVPPALRQRQPDSAAWSLGAKYLAVLNVVTHRITVASLECRSGRYCFCSAVPHEIAASNVPRGISGGRWLCVHYMPSFSGCASQFYLWESAVRGGGGALGGFLPQPEALVWEPSGSLVALQYPSQIAFFQARRRLFSSLCTADLRAAPQHLYFARRALIAVSPRDVTMIFPTKAGAHNLVIASLSSSVSPASDEGGAERPEVHLRPPGALVVANLDEKNFDLYLADEMRRISRIPLHGSQAHLLWTLHSAPYAGEAGWRAAHRMLLAHRKSQLTGGIRRLSTAAVEAFANDCGCGALLTYLDGVSSSAVQSSGTQWCEQQQEADLVVGAALTSVGVISCDGTIPLPERRRQMVALRRATSEQLRYGDPALLSEHLLSRAEEAPVEKDEGLRDAAWWAREFLCDLAFDVAETQ